MSPTAYPKPAGSWAAYYQVAAAELAAAVSRYDAVLIRRWAAILAVAAERHAPAGRAA